MTDKRSFILGMITAFCECVSAGCKDLALSPPLYGADYAAVAREAEEIISKHGLISWHEENADLTREERFDWILIAARRETIDAYLSLRRRGLSPARSLAPFSSLLSYDAEKSVSSGYDAFREYFPREPAR